MVCRHARPDVPFALVRRLPGCTSEVFDLCVRRFVMQPNCPDSDFDFPSLSEIETAQHEILSRVAAQVNGARTDERAFHTSHSSSGSGKGHSSVVTNRASNPQ